MTNIFVFNSQVSVYKNHLNIHRFTSKDKLIPILHYVRFRRPDGSDKVYLIATDRYVMAEAALPLSPRENQPKEGFEFFVHRDDVVRVLKEIKARTQVFSMRVDEDSVSFFVDGTQIIAPVYRDEDGEFGRYPAVDRLWPNREKMNEEPEEGARGHLGINTAYLDKFRHLNYRPTAGMGSGAKMITTGGAKGHVVVLPLADKGWRGLIVPIRVYGDTLDSVVDQYENWEG